MIERIYCRVLMRYFFLVGVSGGLCDERNISWIACPCLFTALRVVGVVHCDGREPEDPAEDGRSSGSGLAFGRALST